MLFCFTNICTKISPHILDFHFCAECHTLALFCQMLMAFKATRMICLKAALFWCLKSWRNWPLLALATLGGTTQVVSFQFVSCCPSWARQREWCNGAAKSQTSNYHVIYFEHFALQVDPVIEFTQLGSTPFKDNTILAPKLADPPFWWKSNSTPL